jgi:ribosomal protein S18 acetylase RimI-like enzyme
MRAPVAESPVSLGPLEHEDALVVRRWLGVFLRQHNRAWVNARGMGWSDAEIDAQVVATDLVTDHWSWLLRAAGRDTSMVRVARVDGVPVGCVSASARVDDYLRTQTGVLDWVYVDPSMRGRRIGSLLVDTARSWMRARGLRSVVVNVLADNEPAMALYRAAGLTVADVRMMGTLLGTDDVKA